MKKIIICLIAITFGAFLVSGLIFNNGEKSMQNVTTTYGTNCTFDFNEGMIAGESGVNGSVQHIAYGNGMMGTGHFISMPESEAQELIQLIQTGEKQIFDGVTYYHFEEKELANGWGAYGRHLELRTTSNMDVAYIQSPVSDEVIIIIGNPESIADCFKTISWGTSTPEDTETESLTNTTTTTTTTTTNTNTPAPAEEDHEYDSIEDAYNNNDWEPSGSDEEDYTESTVDDSGSVDDYNDGSSNSIEEVTDE